MHPLSTDRRLFVKSLAGGASAGLLPTFAPFTVHAAAEGDFLLTNGLTYLNTGTIGPSRRATLDATQRAWETLEANPTAHYGQRVGAPMLEDTRTVAAKFLGCDLDEMAVTASTTAGMNAIAQGLRLGAGDRVLLTDQEHSGGLHCWQYLARHHGVELDVVAIPQGEHRATALVDAIAKGIRRRTRVISASHVFSSTGLRMPIAEVATLARSRGLMCVVDGAQAAGAIRVNVHELGCHAYATSGHKWLLGPKGTGLLYIARDAQASIRPMAYEDNYSTYSNNNGVVVISRRKGAGYFRRNGATEHGHPGGLRMGVPGSVGNLVGACGAGCEPRRAERLAVEHQAVGVVTQPIEGGRGEQAVGGERLVPFGEVEIAGDDGGGLFVALGDQVVEILIGGRAQGLEAEVVDLCVAPHNSTYV